MMASKRTKAGGQDDDESGLLGGTDTGTGMGTGTGTDMDAGTEMEMGMGMGAKHDKPGAGITAPTRDGGRREGRRRRGAPRAAAMGMTHVGQSITVPAEMAPGFAKLEAQFSRMSCLLHATCCMLMALLVAFVLLTLAALNTQQLWECVQAGGTVNGTRAYTPSGEQ
jgi:hypothetical protein